MQAINNSRINQDFVQGIGNSGHQQMQKKYNRRVTFHNYILPIIILMVGAAALIVIFIFITWLDFKAEYDMGDFKIVLPNNLELSQSGNNGVVYKNDNIKFAYTKIDSSDNQLFSVFGSSELLRKLIEQQLSQENGFDIISSGESDLKFYTNDMYGYAKIKSYKEDYYIFILSCSKSREIKYSSSFVDWIADIEFTD